MLKRLDLSIYRKLEIVTDKYCDITGKDNINLALILLYVFYILLCAGVLVEAMLGVAGFWDYTSFVIWGWLVRRDRKIYLELREETEKTEESGTISYRIVEHIIFLTSTRKVFLVLFLILAPLSFMNSEIPDHASNFFFYVGLVPLIASYYIACIVNPGGKKSAWQKLKEKVKQKASELKPVLTPQPIPAPIRSYSDRL